MATNKTARPARILFVVMIMVLLLAALASCADDNGTSSYREPTSESSRPWVTWLLTICTIIALIALFALPIAQLSYGEIIAGILIVMLLLFYYAQPMANWIFELDHGVDEPELIGGILTSVLEALSKPFEALVSVQEFVLDHLPQKTIKFGELTVLRLSTEKSFDTTLVPVAFLILGVAIRVAVARYVRNERLRKLTGEYWLYVLAYLMLAYVISAITNWSFLAVVGLFLLIFLALALGLLRVGGDVLSALLHVLRLLLRIIRIVAKSVVSLATVIADFLKSIGQWIKHLYETYIVAPIAKIYGIVTDFLEGVEERLDEFLGRHPR